jgi:V/A-type H+-transporting ATPase subunit E
VRRERAVLLERRRLLDRIREVVRERLVASGGAELDARLLAEVLPEAGDGPLEVEVDPGAEEAARAALAALSPGAAARAVVRASRRRRGGVRMGAGLRELDDTLPSRLERAWPELEPELAAILFGEG